MNQVFQEIPSPRTIISLSEEPESHLQSHQQSTLISSISSHIKQAQKHSPSVSCKKRMSIVLIVCFLLVPFILWLYKFSQTSNYSPLNNHVSTQQFLNDATGKAQISQAKGGASTNQRPNIKVEQKSHQILVVQQPIAPTNDQNQGETLKQPDQTTKATEKASSDQKLNKSIKKQEQLSKIKQNFNKSSKGVQSTPNPNRKDGRSKKKQQDNILKDIPKNPYSDNRYSSLSKEDLQRVKKWRNIVLQNISTFSPLAEEEKAYFIKKYNVDQYSQLPFCIVIPTFNNKPRKRAERNIASVLMQDYTNYRFIVIDDGSTDGTGVLIKDYLVAQNVNESRYKIEVNQARQFALPNVRRVAKTFCKPEEILIVVDGDDQLLGRQVLKLFNAVFQEKQIWFMYTNFLGSIGTVGYSRPYPSDIIENRQYRKYSFTVSHLRAFYTQLFLNIKDEDLQDQNGKFLTSAGDMAIALPCLEMAHKRALYVPQMTYYYNFNTGLNVHKGRLNEQRINNIKIRAKARYSPLEKLF